MRAADGASAAARCRCMLDALAPVRYPAGTDHLAPPPVEAGLDDRDVRRLIRASAWRPLRRGRVRRGDRWAELDPYPGAAAAAGACGPAGASLHDYVFSHDSAALAHGMGAPDPARALVHVTRRKVHGDADRAGIKHHLAPYTDDQVTSSTACPCSIWPARPRHGAGARPGPGTACCDAALRLGASRRDLACCPRADVVLAGEQGDGRRHRDWPIPARSRGWSPRAACWSPA